MRFDPTRDNLFSMRDEAAHTKLRSKLAAGVSKPRAFFLFTTMMVETVT